jgi:hypothetical protein
MPGRSRASRLALLSAAVVLIGGCGHTQVVGSDRTLRLALTEYRLTPASVRVSAGVLTIVVHNDGVLTHNLAVSQSGQSIYTTKPIWPGQTAEVALSLAPGTYSLASTLLSDQELGEYGTLTVTS